MNTFTCNQLIPLQTAILVILDFLVYDITSILCETWQAKMMSCTYLAKAVSLKRMKHNHKMQAKNLAYSHISLNCTWQKIQTK